MATYSDIRLVKGTFDVTLFTMLRTENLNNVVQFVPSVVTPGNQSSGAQYPRASDLLKITESFVFRCVITKDTLKSAQTIKYELKQLAKGAGIDGGGPVTLTYEDTEYTGYITNLVFKSVNNDNAAAGYNGDDSGEYDITITFTLGVDVS